MMGFSVAWSINDAWFIAIPPPHLLKDPTVPSKKVSFVEFSYNSVYN